MSKIAELNETIGDLKNAVRNKDINLGNIQRDNERLASELKKQQRCNRNLKQQLDDERFFYQREKEHFCQELQTNRSKCQGSTTKFQQQQKREFEQLLESLEDENKELRNEILEKNEVTYNLCIKFLRMKDSRDLLRQKLDRLLQEHLQVMAEMMEKLDEAREELNIIVSEKFQEPLPISKAKFLQIVQRNSKLVYENAELKLHVQQLTQNIERLKSEAQKTKTLNVDARTIEKLAECARRRRSEEATKICSRLPGPNRNKSPPMDKSSAMNSPVIHKSSQVKVVSSLKSKNRSKLTITKGGNNEEPKHPIDLHPKAIQSAPGVVQTSVFRQVQFFETPTNCTDGSERSLDFRDAGTNT
ncbi:cytadherence high molecular weight protein 2-like [Venturia canescens]|uniref:cytadherence high molecular weight protein 2-like n=1 Tax=Venturia canescens TaxID=32260 RepID=UPI001C9CFF74|nr:cytadherence high molecular weight protein 2-like [Venturia canescens]